MLTLLRLYRFIILYQSRYDLNSTVDDMKNLFLILVILLVSCKAQQVSIMNAEWKLTKMGDQDLSTVNPPVTLTLDEAKKGISGHGGCNRYFGGYQSSGETISFTGLGSTKMFCQDTQPIEDAYFKALGTVQSYKTEGNKLYLLAERKVVLEFNK